MLKISCKWPQNLKLEKDDLKTWHLDTKKKKTIYLKFEKKIDLQN
jgi:hypothetical protein